MVPFRGRTGAVTSVRSRRWTSHIGVLLSFALAMVAAPPARAADDAPSLPVSTMNDGNDRQRASDCMTAAIAYEAGNEPLDGKQAVAEVILNRLRMPPYPKTVCGVVFAGSARTTGCQFTFTCDGSLRRHLSERTLAAARAVAEQALDGLAPDRVSGATHYHADYVSPYWRSSLVRVVKLGAHIFYRPPGAADLTVLRAIVPHDEPLIAALSALVAHGRITNVGGSGPSTTPTAISALAFAPWGLAAAH